MQKKSPIFALRANNVSRKLGQVKAAAALLFLCLFVLFSVLVKTELRREKNKSPVAALKIDESMPDFELPDTTGKPVKLSDVLRGKKVVLIDFWASWCGPCRVEMPSFEKLYAAEKDNGFTILAIAEDQDRSKLDEYLKAKPVHFPVLIDQNNALAEKLKIDSFPTTILVGGSGKIREVYEGVHSYIEFSVRRALNEPKQQ